jgi:hypothetical protein
MQRLYDGSVLAKVLQARFEKGRRNGRVRDGEGSLPRQRHRLSVQSEHGAHMRACFI